MTYIRKKRSNPDYNKTTGRVVNPQTDGRVRHGKQHTSEYKIWQSMITRCYTKSRHNYKWYGGRGIIVCTKWKTSFEEFFKDMGLRPSKKYSIDRVNNDGNYEPSNCRWATQKEQRANARPSKNSTQYTYDGKTMYLKEWAKLLGRNYSTLVWRVGFAKMSFEQAINKPFRKSPTKK